jgi:hypothetical protein
MPSSNPRKGLKKILIHLNIPPPGKIDSFGESERSILVSDLKILSLELSKLFCKQFLVPFDLVIWQQMLKSYKMFSY